MDLGFPGRPYAGDQISTCFGPKVVYPTLVSLTVCPQCKPKQVVRKIINKPQRVCMALWPTPPCSQQATCSRSTSRRSDGAVYRSRTVEAIKFQHYPFLTPKLGIAKNPKEDYLHDSTQWRLTSPSRKHALSLSLSPGFLLPLSLSPSRFSLSLCVSLSLLYIYTHTSAIHIPCPC